MQSNLARSLALLVILSFGAAAQETATEDQAAEIDEFEPAVSSADLSTMDSTESDEPAEPQAVLAQDVRRTASATGVMDEIDLERSEITGNQELPKVLYIVPWQKSDPGELTGKPVNTLLDEVLAPVDRTEFIRRVDYYGDLYGTKEE
jgi:hypothetical protein